MKNNKLNNSKKNEKKNNSKPTNNKTVVTKNAKYVLIKENNSLENIKNAFTRIKTSINSKSSNLLKNINLPTCLSKYKPQVVNGLCLTLSSALILTGATLFNSLSTDGNLGTYYSAKSYTISISDSIFASVLYLSLYSVCILLRVLSTVSRSLTIPTSSLFK